MTPRHHLGLYLDTDQDAPAVSPHRWRLESPARSKTHILMVEDNPSDVDLAEIAVDDMDHEIELHAVGDAVEAFSFLAKQGVYAGKPTPHVIVMDIHMPIMTGLKALQIIKDTAAWHQIPVVIFSSSRCPQDRAAALSAGAVAFQNKPERWPEYVALAKRLLACAGAGFNPAQ